MARGWESKAVEAQQEERDRPAHRSPPLSATERRDLAERRTLELALTRARADLARASQPAHRAMLEAAARALESRLAGRRS